MAPVRRPHAARPLFAAAMAALLTLPLAAQAARTGAAGQVVDAETGAPLADARVEIEGSPRFAWTDGAGRFSLSLPPGRYRALIRHPGYHATTEGWWVGDGVLSITVGLQAREIVIDPIAGGGRAGDYGLGERIPLGGGTGLGAPEVWSEEDLRRSGATNLADFLLGRLSLVRVACRSEVVGTRVDEVHDCVRIRGQARRICVAMDESALPGGLSVLSSYRPGDIARVMAFRGGEFVMIYTKDFAYHAKSRSWRPIPPAAQMNAYCRRQ